MGNETIRIPVICKSNPEYIEGAGVMSRLLDRIFPKRREGKPKGYVEYEMLPMVPYVTAPIIKWAIRELDELPDDAVKVLQKKEFSLKNPIQIIGSLIEWLFSANRISEFISMFVCPVGVRWEDRNFGEIAEFLDKNMDAKALRGMVVGFFGSNSVGEISELIRSIRSNLGANWR